MYFCAEAVKQLNIKAYFGEGLQYKITYVDYISDKTSEWMDKYDYMINY